ncbi:hypothetical protein L204_105071 [Cryptococcus depauperatus]
MKRSSNQQPHNPSTSSAGQPSDAAAGNDSEKDAGRLAVEEYRYRGPRYDPPLPPGLRRRGFVLSHTPAIRESPSFLAPLLRWLE